MRNNLAKSFGDKKPIYTLRNTHKYMGDCTNVIYRSTWERTAFQFCDNNPNILLWGSEEIIIDYMKPVFNANGGLTTKPAKYFPDLYVEYVNKKGDTIKELIEIKPKKQTKASKARKYETNFFENMTYIVNMAKWDAAERWCAPRGIKFCLVTEDSLFK
jgi:hypothetical protein